MEDDEAERAETRLAYRDEFQVALLELVKVALELDSPRAATTMAALYSPEEIRSAQWAAFEMGIGIEEGVALFTLFSFKIFHEKGLFRESSG